LFSSFIDYEEQKRRLDALPRELVVNYLRKARLACEHAGLVAENPISSSALKFLIERNKRGLAEAETTLVQAIRCEEIVVTGPELTHYLLTYARALHREQRAVNAEYQKKGAPEGLRQVGEEEEESLQLLIEQGLEQSFQS
tara:strand:- start:40989 stop:41411 length:423 start_codon:yes stop_codon:yes gene_type:complete